MGHKNGSTRYPLLKYLYQARAVSGHVVVDRNLKGQSRDTGNIGHRTKAKKKKRKKKKEDKTQTQHRTPKLSTDSYNVVVVSIFPISTIFVLDVRTDSAFFVFHFIYIRSITERLISQQCFDIVLYWIYIREHCMVWNMWSLPMGLALAYSKASG